MKLSTPLFERSLMLEMAYLEVVDQYLSGFSKKFEWQDEEIVGNTKWPHTVTYLKDVLKYYRRPMVKVLEPREISFQKILDFEKTLPGWKDLPKVLQESIERFTTYIDTKHDLFK